MSTTPKPDVAASEREPNTARSPFLACGCRSVSSITRIDDKVCDPPIPHCLIHDCTEVVEAPDLTGRRARCTYFGTTSKYGHCTGERDSADSDRLAFFEHRPDQQFDAYYCGCWGWD